MYINSKKAFKAIKKLLQKAFPFKFRVIVANLRGENAIADALKNNIIDYYSSSVKIISDEQKEVIEYLKNNKLCAFSVLSAVNPF